MSRRLTPARDDASAYAAFVRVHGDLIRQCFRFGPDEHPVAGGSPPIRTPWPHPESTAKSGRKGGGT